MKTNNSKENLDNAYLYFKTNKITMDSCSKLFNCNRHYLGKILKNEKYQIIKEKFIEESILKHNNKYDYSLVEDFKKVTEKVTILCPIHKEFKQDVYNHKKGVGCPKCSHIGSSIKRINTKERFIEKAEKVHEKLYNYNSINYINTYTKIDITCNIHGNFSQTPNDHIQGKGCLLCARENIGWTKTKWKNKGKNKLAKVYIIRCFNEEEEFLKIGRTFNTVKKRFASKSELPYKFEIIKIYKSFNYDEIWDKEVYFHRKYKEFKYLPKIHFEGKHECFKIDILKELQTIQD